jgi:alpha 1,2-mannosyltransferase
MNRERRRYVELCRHAIANLKDHRGTSSGRGIVTCGALKYLPYLWVLVRSLRDVGCGLPIEIWHLEGEVSPAMRAFFAPYGVRFRLASKLRQRAGTVDRPAYLIKPYALLHSSFREILFLDADNSVFFDPSVVFESTQYLERGAIFWKDFGLSSEKLGVKQLFADFGADTSWDTEFETGQIVIDKVRHWRALNLVLHLNLHHRYYYRYMLGDKDTFRLAFELLAAPYFVIPRAAVLCSGRDPAGGRISYGMIQHWIHAEALFMHEAGGESKWLHGDLLDPAHRCLPNLRRSFVETIFGELRARWELTTSERDFQRGVLYRPKRARRARP